MRSMYDRSLIRDILDNMILASDKIQKRCSGIDTSDDFLKDDGSQMILDSICMQLIAIGQAVKDIDKITDRSLLANYPQIQWRSIAGIRDILSHNYFDLNAETVFGVCSEHIDALVTTLKQIRSEI